MKTLTDEQVESIYHSNDTYSHRKARRGSAAIFSNDRYTTGCSSLMQMLCDLMHYAAKEGKDFKDELKMAESMWHNDTTIDM